MATEIRIHYIISLFSVWFLIITHLNKPVEARIHTLQLKYDTRTYFTLSSFGFYKGGFLEVHLKDFRFSPDNTSKIFGFSLDKTINDAISPYLENHQDRCVLDDEKHDIMSVSVILFTMDLVNKKLKVHCSSSMQSIYISPLSGDNGTRRQRAAPDKFSDSFLLPRKKRAVEAEKESKITEVQSKNKLTTLSPKKTESAVVTNEKPQPTTPVTDDKAKKKSSSDKSENVDSSQSSEFFGGKQCGESGLEITINNTRDKNGLVFETGFIVRITDESEEGLYNLYFHNCPNYNKGPDGTTAIDLTIDIIERNNNNYLSAGEMPLPSVYFFMSILFFLSGCFWIFVLRKSSPQDVFKIHYLMAFLVYVKSFSLLFHGINFHFIQSFGYHIEGWAVLYYITHLLKGALLFITIVMIGTGWALIKHIISDKEKKIFMIVIPLQVLANVAEIIIEESEEGDYAHSAWRDVFILVDLLCCGAILFPVVWSIRHLQEASQTDGKAAINLKKLKLFRHFYIMIVCYIYFTRIIVYLLRITVPFKYEWLDEMFKAVATLIFFVMTGYKFRPASNNPYLQLSQDDNEEEMEEVISRCGVTDGITKINRNKTIDNEHSSFRKESSHEYD